MDLLGGLRRITSGISVVAIAAIGMFACGAMMAFILSPQAALEWRRIQALPELDAAGFVELKTGAEAAITGTLKDNQKLTPEGLVAYEKDIWNVEEPSPPSDSTSTPSKPTGSWDKTEAHFPALGIQISGGVVKTQQVSTVTMSGTMHTRIDKTNALLSAEYDGSQLPDKSIRIQGFANDDLVTIVGKKGATGALIPDRLFGGDRVQLVDEIHTQAQLLFGIGVGMMICSPIFLGVGLGSVIFGRRRGWFGG